MSRLTRWLAPTTTARAHCDLPCGVYDPEQARIEAESCYKIIEKYAANEDATFRARAIGIKERQAELVKHHLDVLWHDYFKPEHLEKVPNLHELFWNANKQVSKVKASTDTADAKTLLDDDRRHRRRLEGDRRRREDPGRRPTILTFHARAYPEAPPCGGASSYRIPPSPPARPVATRRASRPAWSRVSARATGCSSIRPRTAGRAAGRSSRSTSPTAAPSRSSGSPARPAIGCRFATATSSSPTTRPGSSPTRPRRRPRRPASARRSTPARSVRCRLHSSSGGSGSATRQFAGSGSWAEAAT